MNGACKWIEKYCALAVDVKDGVVVVLVVRRFQLSTRVVCGQKRLQKNNTRISCTGLSEDDYYITTLRIRHECRWKNYVALWSVVALLSLSRWFIAFGLCFHLLSAEGREKDTRKGGGRIRAREAKWKKFLGSFRCLTLRLGWAWDRGTKAAICSTFTCILALFQHAYIICAGLPLLHPFLPNADIVGLKLLNARILHTYNLQAASGIWMVVMAQSADYKILSALTSLFVSQPVTTTDSFFPSCVLDSCVCVTHSNCVGGQWENVRKSFLNRTEPNWTAPFS